jgi:ATP-dependent DNA helicase RecQ
VDKDDVRLVLHACVPETVDRFYQEVGRGGRDGRASVSMMLWTKVDCSRAERLSSPKIISEELGFDRWRAMWTAGRIEGDVAFIDLQAKRAGVAWDGEHNAAWNLKTLLLLARARVLEIEHSPLSEISRNPAEADEDFRLRSKALREKHQALCPIRLLQANPLTARAWESQVGAHRDKSKAAAAANWQRMEDVLTARRPLTDILREVYRVPSAGIHDVASEAQAITLIPPRSVCTQLGDPLRCALPGDGKGLLLVTYRTNGVAFREMIVALVELLKRLAKNGIREVALPAVWRTQTTWPGSLPNPLKSMTGNAPENFLIVRRLDEEDPLLHGYIAVPRVSLVPPEKADEPIPEFLLTLNRPVHIILVPEECPDNRNPARRVGEVSPPESRRMEDFQRLLKQ